VTQVRCSVTRIATKILRHSKKATAFIASSPTRTIVFIMTPPVEIARPSKFTNAQTILYEIDMFRFAAGKLVEQNDPSSWLALECFLLHFRNLIEFFGKEPRGDDLSIRRSETIWPDATARPTAEALTQLHREDLWERYEVRDATQFNDKISRYLQHCTEQRVEGRNWRVREMFEELQPTLSEFENLLTDTTRPWENPSKPSAKIIVGPISCSTASPTALPVASLGLTSLKKLSD
jgi:hypothetical protein